ncbi:MAG: hypothetical protein SFU56_03125, partial [Capsulimonadales bacterium]|nr:hypothetical protein [Capsulimonadales bacterium]
MSRVMLYSLLSLATLTFSIAWGDTFELPEAVSLSRGGAWCLAMAAILFRFGPWVSSPVVLQMTIGILALIPTIWDLAQRGRA